MKIAAIIIFLSISVYSFSQDNELKNKFTKNTLYITTESLVIQGCVNINYERKIVKSNDNILSSLWIKVGYGAWFYLTESGSQYIVSAVGLSGQGKHHFEYSFGVTSFYNNYNYEFDLDEYEDGFIDNKPTKWEYTDVFPIASIGYRYQKPNGHFVFRTGFVVPQPAFYFSLGLVF